MISAMSLSNSSHPGSPIQRLIIFHLNFDERCSGEPLGEGASLDELKEQILYYHRHDRDTSSTFVEESGLVSPGHRQFDVEEAVQFVGLCTALYRLPSTLDGWSDLKDDRTKEVHFDDSSLAFIPLEASENLIAVAQISRLYIRGSKHQGGGGNPLAVRQSIQKCHKLFCLLRGGGIINRLSFDTEPIDTTKSVDTDRRSVTYPGMKEVFRIRKEYRRNRDKASRLDSQLQDERVKLDEDAVSLKEEINTLVKSLPIHSIRKDLSMHYGEYLGELSIITSRCGCAARCLVEAIPAPVATNTGLHMSKCAPASLSSHCAVRFGLAIREILEEQNRYRDKRPLITGISSFLKGQLLYNHLSTSMAESSEEWSYCLSRETATLLMGYMASYRCKMSQHVVPLREPSPSHTSAQPRLSSLKRFGLFGTATDDVPTSEDGDVLRQDQEPPPGQFQTPPPLFMMSASDRTHCFVGSNNSSIWAPKVHLPIEKTAGHMDTTFCVEVHVVLFQTSNFDFLVYIDSKMRDPSWEAEERVGLVCDSNSTALVDGYPLSLPESNHFEFFDQIGHELIRITNEVEGDSDNGVTRPRPNVVVEEWEQPGQDIVFVDRLRHELVLFSGRTRQAAKKAREAQRSNGINSRRRFLGFPTAKSTQSEKVSTSEGMRYSDSEWSALGLDCRHRLASYLPLDIVLAFDDMMNEVQNAKAGKGASNSRNDYLLSKTDLSTDGYLELCTCMPQGWVYAFAYEGREIFAYFDSSIYVTVADVQSAALEIRKRIFG